jgi:hypothetical protein
MHPFDHEQQSFNKSALDDETLLSGQSGASCAFFSPSLEQKFLEHRLVDGDHLLQVRS